MGLSYLAHLPREMEYLDYGLSGDLYVLRYLGDLIVPKKLQKYSQGV
jgi:hypothetical protein